MSAPKNRPTSPIGENWAWITAHPEILENYRGEYVAIWDRRVVLHGADHRQLKAAIRKSPYWGKPMLVFRVPTREEMAGNLVL